jgi:hypothetical protein
MKKNVLLLVAVALVVLILTAVMAYRHWSSGDGAEKREAMLSMMPGTSTAVVFLDLEQFRSSAFLPQLFQWAPSVSVEEDYAKFVQATGFNYERDLDRVAISFTRRDPSSKAFAVAEGKFDRKKIEDYAGRSGQRIIDKNLIVFALDPTNSGHKSYFTFLRDDRIAWTNDPVYEEMFQPARTDDGKQEWQERFSRLSGSAVLGVIRQDSATAGVLAQQAPGGFRSPQLATLLSQLQWITIGGKPVGTDLRVVMEGECSSDTTIHQLRDFLSGLLLLAQAGLSGPQNRNQMDPQLRSAYLQLLKSADVEDVDRGAEKSVRVVLELTPDFLKAVKKASTAGVANGH